MFRSIAIAAAVAALLSACVTLSPAPTAAPATAPSFRITTPVPVGTASPAATAATFAPPTIPRPSATASAIVSSPTVPATSAPTVAPTGSPALGANDLLWHDNMDDPTSGWDTYATDLAEVAWDVGALEIAISSDDTYAYSSRELGDDFGVALAAAEFIPTGAGSAGLLCIGTGDSGADLAHGVIFTQDGAVIFVSIDGGTQEILEINEGVGTELPEGQSSIYGLACAGTSTGALRLTAFGDRTGPLATYQVNEGAESFSSVAAYGEASTAGFALDVSTVAVYGIPGSTEGMSPEGEELLTHVPPEWQSQCIESPTTESEVAIVVCMLQQDGAGPEFAAYSLYENNEAMDAEYQARVSEFGGQTPSGDCREGPNETTWNFEDGDAVGRVQCAPQHSGIRMDWTDERLQILSNVIDFDGDYATLYEAWLNAGPIDAP